ncbi:beta-ketoacyl-[acyl-carrier-protein] synthase family protein [Enterobacter pasteurii]|uniref:Beta-ketoacyl-[acyl-carrier-protein] synthase family protein n=2 Tax=Enterobacter cloacae complex TaxID=354276 RepID=A0A7H8UAV6_ENTCL|nr:MULTISPECIES: beta-ketoacyl-[acyl-carrier-protein] synthase family protein [Enterobacter cloacae complex]MBE4854624.1 beta-ketoacyl-[acyl-carrier-protein] synthase family protein [Enterobacter pasteurii]MBE4862898.1 beta-ketoacyl-[acyl-carrier-protein] synthase family protein [Enterobacter cloacae complex sp. P40C2]MBE4876602.1 beta-ketoacyl-[acyl-carrier-protein] synthase family protein [Enterobacter cloacae complex sp. P40C]MDE4082611.1 beta-ketoacyl-[acyl-carrier-protein] synthase family 
MKRNDGYKRVVVTGYGAVTPLGATADESWQAIMRYRLGYRYVDNSARNIKTYFLGLVDNEPSLSGVPAVVRRRLPRFARLTLGAARQAMAMAFGGEPPQEFYSPLDCGAIMGTGWGGLDESYHAQSEFATRGLASPFTCFYSMPSVTTAACSQFWGLNGYQNTVVAACATGTIAIGEAYEVIRSGRAQMMLAGAGESLTSHCAIWNIDVLGALSKEASDPQRASCPFSAHRSGFVLSEGAAVLCLEEREGAIARGATILGEVTGYANFSDAWDFTSPAEDCLAREHTITCVLQQAGLQPEQLDYINAHGTSTPLNDINETQSLKMALGDAAWSIPVSSTKSYTGHLISAAGTFESIVCLQAIGHGIIPATTNYQQADERCDLDYVIEGHRAGNIRRTLNLSFGFGGANAALILEKHA